MHARDQVVPFRVSQPHGVLVLPNGDALVGNFHDRTTAASRTQRDFNRFHLLFTSFA